MQRLEVSGAVRHIYGSLGVKRLRIVAAVYKIRLKSCDRQIAAKGNENERQTRKRAAGKQDTL